MSVLRSSELATELDVAVFCEFRTRNRNDSDELSAIWEDTLHRLTTEPALLQLFDIRRRTKISFEKIFSHTTAVFRGCCARFVRTFLGVDAVAGERVGSREAARAIF